MNDVFRLIGEATEQWQARFRDPATRADAVVELVEIMDEVAVARLSRDLDAWGARHDEDDA